MFGTVVNSGAVIVGTILGLLLKGRMPERLADTVTKGLALCVCFMGISDALKSGDTMLLLISIAVGSVIGEWIDIDRRLNNLGQRIQNKFAKGGDSRMAEAFVGATLLFCLGPMAILGALKSGLSGDHEILMTKSILDGISSIVFASTLGAGVALAAVALFLYQGAITLFSSSLQSVLTDALATQISGVGGLLILGLGLNMLGVTKIKIANFLPSILVACLYFFLFSIV